LEQQFLDLSWIDVEAAADDEISSSTAQRVVSVRRPRGDIAGAKPPVVERGCRCVRASPIAGEEMRRLDLHFTDGVVPKDRSVVANDTCRDARQWRPNTAGTTLALVEIAHDHERLAHAVPLEDRVPVPRAKRLVDVRGKRRGSGNEESGTRS